MTHVDSKPCKPSSVAASSRTFVMSYAIQRRKMDEKLVCAVPQQHCDEAKQSTTNSGIYLYPTKYSANPSPPYLRRWERVILPVTFRGSSQACAHLPIRFDFGWKSIAPAFVLLRGKLLSVMCHVNSVRSDTLTHFLQNQTRTQAGV